MGGVDAWDFEAIEIDIIDGGGRDTTDGDGGQGNATCDTAVDSAVEDGNFRVNNDRDPSATKGRQEGTKGQELPKRRNPECLQLVSIRITPATGTVAIAASLQLTATGTYSDGSTRNITDSLVWVSSNGSVARVTTGLVQGLANGTVLISAREAKGRLSDASLPIVSNTVEIRVGTG